MTGGRLWSSSGWAKHPRNLSDKEKFALLEGGHCTPAEEFVFAAREYGKRIIRFQRSWLRKYSWLVYSKELNGGFCLPCLLFSAPDASRGPLFNSPLVYFAHAADNLKSHGEKLKAHLDSVQKAVAFRQTVNQ